jgi:hypothetical protein
MFYAVTVALLVGVVVSAWVLFAHLRSQRAEAFLNAARTADNARSAAIMALAVLPNEGGSVTMTLHGEMDDSVQVERIPFGILDLIVSHAHRHGHHVRMFGYGAGALNAKGPVLQMPDRQGAVHLSGDARLAGDVVVPNGDVRRGHIEGRTYTGEQLVEGAVVPAQGGLPPLATGLPERLRALCNGASLGQLHGLEQQGDGRTHVRYQMPIMEFIGPTSLAGMTIMGPCVIRCTDTLTIATDSQLDMVVVQAPFIKMEEGFTGAVQCFARRGMLIGEDCRLKYPSLLAVVRDGHDAAAPKLHLGARTFVQGGVAFVDQQVRGRATGGVIIEADARIEGELFVAGDLQLHGEVRGSVITDRLLVRTPTATYEGHLLDGVIAGFPHDETWCIGLTNGQAPRTIVAWRKFPSEG